MSAIFTPMPIKEWTPDQISELVALAKSRGIKQGELAEDYVGVHFVTLSKWSNADYGSKPSNMARNALSFAELRIRKMKER